MKKPILATQTKTSYYNTPNHDSYKVIKHSNSPTLIGRVRQLRQNTINTGNSDYNCEIVWARGQKKNLDVVSSFAESVGTLASPGLSNNQIRINRYKDL